MTWGTAFLLTQLIELPIYWLGTRRAPLSPAWRLAIGFGASALTHPIVWFVLRDALEPRFGFWPYFVVAETFAVVAEGAYLWWFGVGRWSLALSLLANTSSASFGLVLWALSRG